MGRPTERTESEIRQQSRWARAPGEAVVNYDQNRRMTAKDRGAETGHERGPDNYDIRELEASLTRPFC